MKDGWEFAKCGRQGTVQTGKAVERGERLCCLTLLERWHFKDLEDGTKNLGWRNWELRRMRVTKYSRVLLKSILKHVHSFPIRGHQHLSLG